MRVLGIDPGSLHTGWGVVDNHGSRVKHMGSGTLSIANSTANLVGTSALGSKVKLSAALSMSSVECGDFASRLVRLADGLEELLHRFQPDQCSVESLFHHKNSQSALKLGHARGVILLVLRRGGYPIYEYAPAEMKRAIGGNGRADKKQVRRMVELLLGTKITGGEDATDALGLALCHLQFAPRSRNDGLRNKILNATRGKSLA